MAVLAAFERFVFGSRHDFFISDFLPFSQSRLSNQCLTWDFLNHAYQINWEDGGELLLHFACYS